MGQSDYNKILNFADKNIQMIHLLPQGKHIDLNTSL
jgi:hypothetical protein